MKIKFKKTDIIAKVLEQHPNAEEILTSFGFHCLYCPCAQMETLEEACQVHEVNITDLLKALNA
jgi:hydroxylamine reductase